MFWILIFIPVISAFIGWFVIFIVLKMLFHPAKPKKIFGITFRGFFPKKHTELAIKAGKIASEELLSFTEIEQTVSNPANIEKIVPLLEKHIDIFLREKLAAEIPMIGMLIGEKTISQVKAVFMKELREIFPGLLQQYMITLRQDFDLEKLISEKAGRISLVKFEYNLKSLLSKELKSVQLFGAVAGFIIGMIDVVIILALK